LCVANTIPLPGSGLRRESTIEAIARPSELLLSYTVAAGTEREEFISYAVTLSSTPCTYGGSRPWFVCPGRRCVRRVATLYRVGNYFLCRHCGRLAYVSQRLDREERLRRRAGKIRVRLGGDDDRCADFPPKPKGLHWRTYWALEDEHWRLQHEAEGLATLGSLRFIARLDPLFAASVGWTAD
jgi:hypothetical protein